MRKSAYLMLSSSLLFAACSGLNSDTKYPQPKEQADIEKIGKLTGEEGFVLFGGKKRAGGTVDAINVNAYLWRASLDYIHFMPLISADPFGGTIITDWYSSTENAHERFKVNIFIIGSELRSDALKITVFKQVRGAGGQWHDKPANSEMAKEIEDKILLRAREIKVNSL